MVVLRVCKLAYHFQCFRVLGCCVNCIEDGMQSRIVDEPCNRNANYYALFRQPYAVCDTEWNGCEWMWVDVGGCGWMEQAYIGAHWFVSFHKWL